MRRRFNLNITAANPQYAGYTPTIYAAPTALGNGSGSSEANARALSSVFASAIAPGTIVGLLPGVYWRNTSSGIADRFGVAWNSPSSGTAGSPIRFVAKYAAALYPNDPAAWSDMRCNMMSGGLGGPAFGANGRNYVEWVGVFGSDEAGYSYSADDTGPCVFVNATGGGSRYCRVRGAGAKWGANNYHGLNSYNCVGTSFLRNDVSNFYTGSVGASNANGGGIVLDGTAGGLVEGNYVWGCGSAIYHKRADQSGGGSYNPGNWIVRYNHTNNCRFGVRWDSNHDEAGGDNSYTTDIYQNLIVGGGAGLHIGNSSLDRVGKVRMQNNTLIGVEVGLFVTAGFADMDLVKHWNNIVYGPTINAFAFDGISLATLATLTQADLESEHNVYFSVPASFIDGDSMAPQNRAYWQSTLGQDNAAPAAITSDPLFVGGTGVAAYKLQAGSPARTIGRDLLNLSGLGAGAIIPAGCYITGNETIGVG